jgi:DNA-binding NarL/FixJ family response regulator
VAELITKGLSNKEVANQLFVTEKTIKFHLTQIFEKLNIKKTSEYRSKRVELITYCSKLTKEGN